ncbi:MAG TPA: hypothetical protein VJ065_02515 [Patescibacteria group bacterium]|nr:hypothetical protein [Patescibacteria group bacterium]
MTEGGEGPSIPAGDQQVSAERVDQGQSGVSPEVSATHESITHVAQEVTPQKQNLVKRLTGGLHQILDAMANLGALAGKAGFNSRPLNPTDADAKFDLDSKLRQEISGSASKPHQP